jgi:hypothetical protein
VATERAGDPDGGEPRADRRQQRQTTTGGHGAAIHLVGAEEAGRDRRQHEDRLQALTKDEDGAVDDRRRPAHVLARSESGGVGRPALGVPAQDDRGDGHGQHDEHPDRERRRAVGAVGALGADC